MDRFFGLDKSKAPMKEAELLITVNDTVEKSLICGMLEEEKIPYLAKDRGSGEATRILTGFSVFGCDIYVPKAAYERAAELLEVFRGGEMCEGGEEDSSAAETEA